MLVLSRKINEKIIISLRNFLKEALRLKDKGLSSEQILEVMNSEIQVVCVRVASSTARLGIEADELIDIVREELLSNDSDVPS